MPQRKRECQKEENRDDDSKFDEAGSMRRGRCQNLLYSLASLPPSSTNGYQLMLLFYEGLNSNDPRVAAVGEETI